MHKKCSNCKETKEIEQFALRNKQKDIRQEWCRSCHRLHDRKRWLSSPELRLKHKQWAQKQREKARQFIKKYLATHSCIDCGNNNPIVLEFDHLSDKCFNVADAPADGRGIASIQKEIMKCQVVCANCHRIRTAKRRNETT